MIDEEKARYEGKELVKYFAYKNLPLVESEYIAQQYLLWVQQVMIIRKLEEEEYNGTTPP